MGWTILPRLVWKILGGTPWSLVSTVVDAFGINWKTVCNPSHTPRSRGKPFGRVKNIIRVKLWLNLDWVLNQAHMSVTVRCPHTLGHVMYIYSGYFFSLSSCRGLKPLGTQISLYDKGILSVWYGLFRTVFPRHCPSRWGTGPGGTVTCPAGT